MAKRLIRQAGMRRRPIGQRNRTASDHIMIRVDYLLSDEKGKTFSLSRQGLISALSNYRLLLLNTAGAPRKNFARNRLEVLNYQQV